MRPENRFSDALSEFVFEMKEGVFAPKKTPISQFLVVGDFVNPLIHTCKYFVFNLLNIICLFDKCISVNSCAVHKRIIYIYNKMSNTAMF